MRPAIIVNRDAYLYLLVNRVLLIGALLHKLQGRKYVREHLYYLISHHQATA